MTQPDRSATPRVNIAIDGPAGAGKSTIARLVALELGYVYIDTGSMYRAVSLHMTQAGIRPDETDMLVKEMKRLTIRLCPEVEHQLIFLNDEDVTDALRTSEVSRLASLYAQVGVVRDQLVEIQRLMAARKGVVMDGRDIGTHVLPDADLKWFLTASIEERARRRYAEWQNKERLTLEQFTREIVDRDQQDETRELAPLRQAEDAIRLNTTGMTIDEVVRVIVDRVKIRK